MLIHQRKEVIGGALFGYGIEIMQYLLPVSFHRAYDLADVLRFDYYWGYLEYYYYHYVIMIFNKSFFKYVFFMAIYFLIVS
jgi:hypothetical protein